MSLNSELYELFTVNTLISEFQLLFCLENVTNMTRRHSI